MLRRSLIAGSVLLLGLSVAAQQQDNSAPPPAQNPPNAPAPQKKDSPPKDQPKKSTADQNPFPEAQSEAAAHQQNSAPNAPQPQTTPQPGSPAKPGDQNPFPQQQSEKAAHQDQPQDKSAAPENTGEYSSSQVKGLDMPTTDETPPPNLPPSSLPYNPKLARKDAEIGDFYMQSGNWRGAYERFIEANRSDPGNPEAVFGLAESARRLSHMDEALRNYRLYLSALPNGPHAKEVRKALKEMGAAPPA
jgi:tetratricopeptide (TPR) repeat protein